MRVTKAKPLKVILGLDSNVLCFLLCHSVNSCYHMPHSCRELSYAFPTMSN